MDKFRHTDIVSRSRRRRLSAPILALVLPRRLGRQIPMRSRRMDFHSPALYSVTLIGGSRIPKSPTLDHIVRRKPTRSNNPQQRECMSASAAWVLPNGVLLTKQSQLPCCSLCGHWPKAADNGEHQAGDSLPVNSKSRTLVESIAQCPEAQRSQSSFSHIARNLLHGCKPDTRLGTDVLE